MKIQFSFMIQHNPKIPRHRAADIETVCVYLYADFVTFIYVHMHKFSTWSYKICIYNFVHYKTSASLIRSEFRGSLKSDKRHWVTYCTCILSHILLCLFLNHHTVCVSVCSLSPALLSQMSSISETRSHSDISSTRSQDKLSSFS